MSIRPSTNQSRINAFEHVLACAVPTPNVAAPAAAITIRMRGVRNLGMRTRLRLRRTLTTILPTLPDGSVARIWRL